MRKDFGRRHFLRNGLKGLGASLLIGFPKLHNAETRKEYHARMHSSYIDKGVSELFADDFMIANMSGLQRVIHQADKLPTPVLEAEKPWEMGERYEGKFDRRIYIYGTVYYDASQDQYRMWYNRYRSNYYATSKNGIDWERPNLQLLGDNNMIDLPEFHSTSIIWDHFESNPQRRFKAVGSTPGGYRAAYSGDGLNWTLYRENPILVSGDTITLSQDPQTGEYLAFHKRSRDPRVRGRQVFLSISRDMQVWSKPEPVMVTDGVDHAEARLLEGGTHSEFYNMSAFPYGNQWLGFVTHFRRTGKPKVMKGPFQSSAEGPIDVQLVHSRDGRNWHRFTDRTPIIPLGPHHYDSGSILGLCNHPVVTDKEVWMYYTAMTTTHGGHLPEKVMSIARASWSRDRMVSLQADNREGMVETQLLTPGGSNLQVNYQLKPQGAFKVEILDDTGNVKKGYEAALSSTYGSDGLFKTIKWKNQSMIPGGEPIKLRFSIRNGDLFSYKFT